MTVWLPGWRAQNFTKRDGKPVLNKQLITYISSLLSLRNIAGQKVLFKYVAGHSGIEGNESADALAVEGTQLAERSEDDWESLQRQVEKEAEEIMRLKTSERLREKDSSIFKVCLRYILLSLIVTVLL